MVYIPMDQLNTEDKEKTLPGVLKPFSNEGKLSMEDTTDTLNGWSVYAQGLKNIFNIGKGLTYTPPPPGLSLKEQIQWSAQQSEQAKKAQLGIRTGLGTLQTFGESTVPGMVEKAIGNLVYKLFRKPSPFLEQKDVIVPELAKAGINVAGFASDMAILNALTAPISVKISSKLAPSFKYLHPIATRVITEVPVEALRFATRGGLYETANELADGKFSPIKIMKEMTKEGVRGAWFGLGRTIPSSAIGITLGGGISLGGWTAIEKLYKNGKITRQDIPDIALNTALGMALAAIGSKQTADAYKRVYLNDMSHYYEVSRIQNSLGVDQQTAVRLADLVNKANVVRIISGNNEIAKSLYNKLRVTTGEFNEEYLVQTPEGLRLPKKISDVDLDDYFTPAEKVLLEQLNLYQGPAPNVPILTPAEPAYVKTLQQVFPNRYIILSPDKVPIIMSHADSQIGGVPTALDMLNKVSKGESLKPIEVGEPLMDMVKRILRVEKEPLPIGLSTKEISDEEGKKVFKEEIMKAKGLKDPGSNRVIQDIKYDESKNTYTLIVMGPALRDKPPLLNVYKDLSPETALNILDYYNMRETPKKTEVVSIRENVKNRLAQLQAKAQEIKAPKATEEVKPAPTIAPEAQKGVVETQKVEEEKLPELTPEEEKAYEEEMNREIEREKKKFMKEERDKLFDEIKKVGKIMVTPDVAEELSRIPSELLAKKGGLAYDKMIAVLRERGYYDINSLDDLIETITQYKEGKVKVTPSFTERKLKEIKQIKVPLTEEQKKLKKMSKLERDVHALGGLDNPNILEDLKIYTGREFKNIEELKSALQVQAKAKPSPLTNKEEARIKRLQEKKFLEKLQQDLQEEILKNLKEERIAKLREEKKELLGEVEKKIAEMPRMRPVEQLKERRPSTYSYNNPYTKWAYRIWDRIAKGDAPQNVVYNLAKERYRVMAGLISKLREDYVRKVEKLPLAEKQRLGLMFNDYIPIAKEYQGLIKDIGAEIGALSKLYVDYSKKWVAEGLMDPENAFLSEETALENLGVYVRNEYLKLSSIPGKGVKIVPGAGMGKGIISTSMFKPRKTLYEWGKQALLYEGKSDTEIMMMTTDEVIKKGLEAKQAYGFITQADVVLDRTFKQMVSNVATMQWMDIVAHSPNLFSKTPKEGFVPVKELVPRGVTDKRLGPLAKGFINPALADDIKLFTSPTTKNVIEKILGEPLSWWKMFKVAGNVATVVRNWISGAFIQTDMAGYPLWILRNIKKYIFAFKSYVTKNDFYKLIRDHGGYGMAYFTVEIDPRILDIMENSNDPLGVLEKHWLEKLGDKIKDVKKLGNYYGAIDHIQRTYLIKCALDDGFTIEEAINFANKWELDYKFPPRVLAKMVELARGPIGGWIFPFVSFYTNMAPRILETTVTRPWVFLKYIIAILALNYLARQTLHLTEEQVKNAKPDYLKDSPYTLLLPYKDKDNNLIFVDLTYTLPFGGPETLFLDLPGIKNMFTGMGLAGGIMAVVNNYDFYTKQPLYDEHDLPAVKKAKVTSYILRFLSPGTLPHILNVIDAIEGKPIGWPIPRTKGVTQTALRGLGISTYTGGYNEAIIKIRNLEKEISDLQYGIKKTEEDMILKKVSRKEAKERIKETNDIILRKQLEIIKIRKAMSPFPKVSLPILPTGLTAIKKAMGGGKQNGLPNLKSITLPSLKMTLPNLKNIEGGGLPSLK